MAEDAFERFRRLRGIAQPVSERVSSWGPLPMARSAVERPKAS
jgi:hypothetical protein